MRAISIHLSLSIVVVIVSLHWASLHRAIAEDAAQDCVPFKVEMLPVPEADGFHDCRSLAAAEFVCAEYKAGEKNIVIFDSISGKITQKHATSDAALDLAKIAYTKDGYVEFKYTAGHLILKNLATGAETIAEKSAGDGWNIAASGPPLLIGGRSFVSATVYPEGGGAWSVAMYEIVGNKLVRNDSVSEPTIGFGNLAVWSSHALPWVNAPQSNPTPENDYVVIDTVTGRTVMRLPKSGQIDADVEGRRITHYSFDKQKLLTITDAVTGEVTKTEYNWLPCAGGTLLDQRGSNLIFQCPNGINVADVRTKTFARIDGPNLGYGKWAGKYFQPNGYRGLEKFNIRQVCFNSGRYQVSSEVQAAGCPPQGTFLSATDQEALSRQLLCSSNFKKEEWDTARPIPARGTISSSDAVLFLQRFGKPGGFEPEIHTPLLDAILTSEVVTKNADLALNAISTISLQHPDAAPVLARFQGRIDELEQKSGSNTENCLTADEKQAIQTQLIQLVNKIAGPDYKNFSTAKRALRPHLSTLKQLPKDTREELLTQLARANARVAAEREYYLGKVFSSKLVVFSKKAFSPLFGGSPPPATDVVLLEGQTRLIPLVIGTHPIERARRNDGLWNRLVASVQGSQTSFDSRHSDFGFYFVALDSVPKRGGAVNVDWRHGGNKFSSRFEVKKLENSDTWVPMDSSPRYNELWADGVMSGIVVAGANLGNEVAGQTIENFLSYYTDRDFEFSETPEAVPDPRAYLEKKIVSGELDYFVKQAHSDGDERNLFQLPPNGLKLTGRKKLPGGREERIELLYPANPGRGDYLSNQEFGDWMRNRKGGQLVYLNGSCNSYYKARAEIRATQSSKLLNIPTVNNVVFFRDLPEESGQYQFFDAFLAGKSYKEIREAIAKSNEFKSGKTHYIFPDDVEYQQTIIQELDAFEIKTKLLDGSQAVYNFDPGH